MTIDPAKAITVAGVLAYDEGVREHFGEEQSAEWTIVCEWADRGTIIRALVGYVSSSGEAITVVPPFIYLDIPWLYVKGVDVEGIGAMSVGENGMAAWEFARLTVHFEPREPTDAADARELGAINLDFGSEVFSFNGGVSFYKWATTGVDIPPEATPGKIVPIMTFKKTKKGITRLPITELFTILQKPVNSDTCLGIPPGYMRYEGATTEREFFTNGSRGWSITMTFSIRGQKWNEFFNPATGLFEAIVSKVGSKPFYESTPFAPLKLE